ncbi:MAG: hypothetical protein Q8R76_06705 [Candidatus Omnitrophota bacterium]|nr:hypothetical protein [Candidatus Omnitrophota bacterium]
MNQPKQLPVALFTLRITVFVVFFVWCVDKFVRPDHASKVFEIFYGSPAFGPTISYLIGALQMVLLIGFLLGIQKKITYGALLLFHFISTVSSYKQYLAPYEGMNLLFFAAWPMLAACYALYILRDSDTLWSLKKT